MKYKRFTEKRKGKNVIPLLNRVCGVDLPKWCISEESNIRAYLSGDAVDRLAELEDKIENGTLVELEEDKVVIDKHKYILANKCYSYATLKSYSKSDLIEHIRILEHNWASAEEKVNNQANYLQDKVVLSKEEYERLRNLEINYEDTYENYREYAIENNKLKAEIRQASELKAETIKLAKQETARDIIDKVDDMIGGKMIAQALREIYLGEE